MNKNKLLFTSIALVSLVGCAEPSKQQQVAVELDNSELKAQKIEAKKDYEPNPNWETIRVGSEVSYEPFEFKNENGYFVGFEVDLIQEIAKAEEFNVHISDYPRKKILDTFDEHNVSIWASALSIKPTRQAIMDLSDPIITTEVSAFVLDNEKNADIVDINSLKNKTFAVSKGASASTLEQIVEISGKPDAPLLADNFYLAIVEVYNGNADAIIGDNRVVSYYMQQYPEHKLKKIAINNNQIELAFAVKKGDSKTLEKVNSGLAKVKANGTYDKLVEKWFGAGYK